ncbi:hypothetical protein NDU88_005935 [Pleurodeles waltl]|uniref:Uncharacterized protein n=1 Tax=Pleurodeles waltl TaxID=8319 RepID=A0AAV7X266_PLEWA|nr:hypothetical protein NDU88_005935 [Pleurodeles waltl]
MEVRRREVQQGETVENENGDPKVITHSSSSQKNMGKQRTAKDMPTGLSPRDVTGETAGGDEVLVQHTTEILAAIQESKTALESQIATLAGEVGLLRDEHNKFKDHVKATEDTLGGTA